MKKNLLLGVAVVLLCGCHHNDGKWGVQSFWGGDDLKQMCDQAKSDATALVVCDTYIIGAVDSYAANYRKEHGTDWLCGNPQKLGVMNATIDYMAAHPDQLSGPAGTLVIHAVGKAYGCDQK